MVEDVEALRRMMKRALLDALEGDMDSVRSMTARIAVAHGPEGAYLLCCAFATMAANAVRERYGTSDDDAPDFWELKVDPGVSPHALFAGRFIAAVLQKDVPQCEALFVADLEAGGDKHPESVDCLIRSSMQLIWQPMDGGETGWAVRTS